MDFGTSTEASSGVCLELVTQHLLLTVELAHVVHAALKERRWVHLGNTLPGQRENAAQASVLHTHAKNNQWLLAHLKGPVVSLILPHLSGFTTSASRAGLHSGSGLEPWVQLLNTTTSRESIRNNIRKNLIMLFFLKNRAYRGSNSRVVLILLRLPAVAEFVDTRRRGAVWFGKVVSWAAVVVATETTHLVVVSAA